MKFGFSREKDLAKELVARLSKELPPDALEKRNKVSVNKITRLLEKTYGSAAAYQLEHRPGFIRRSVLANAFRWGLKEAGYSDEFLNVAVEGLVVEMSRAAQKPKS